MPDPRTKIDEALAEIGKEFGLALALDGNDVVTLEFSDDISCAIEAPTGSERIFFHANVCVVPRSKRERTLAIAMKHNLFQQSLPGSWLALDGETDAIVLCATIPAAMVEPDLLADFLAAMVSEVKSARAAVAATDDDAEASLVAMEDALIFR